MSFPITPADGTEYESPSGIFYKYVASNNSWVILPPEAGTGPIYEYTELTGDIDYPVSVIDANNSAGDNDFSFTKGKGLTLIDENFSINAAGKNDIRLLDPIIYGDFSDYSTKYNFTLTL